MNNHKALAAVSLSGFGAFLHLYATQGLLTYFAGVFGEPHVRASLTVGATTMAVALSAPISALLSESLDRKKVIVAAVMALSFPAILSATATSLDALLAWRFVQGICISFIFSNTLAYTGEKWRNNRPGRAMSFYLLGNICGGVCGRMICSFVAERMGWRIALGSLGLMTLGIGLVVWSWMENPLNCCRWLRFWFRPVFFDLARRLRTNRVSLTSRTGAFRESPRGEATAVSFRSS